MYRCSRRLRRICCTLMLFVVSGGLALAQYEKAGDVLGSVDQLAGSYQTSIPIELPPFHGIEPPLALTYSSARGNGLLGVGWELTGFSKIERAGPGYGAPSYNDATDVFLLDGQKLIKCPASGSLSPSCNNPDGGSGDYYSTERESFLRIKYEPGTVPTSRWTVWRKDGTKVVYEAIWYTTEWGTFPYRTYRWGVHHVEEGNGNRVNYQWDCDHVPIPSPTTELIYDCRPYGLYYADLDGTATNSVTIRFYSSLSRPDPITFAMGELYKPSVRNTVTPMGLTRYRLDTVDVSVGGICDPQQTPNVPCPSRARAYKLLYEADSDTKRSNLVSVQMYGKDAVLDFNGVVVAGTGSSLPLTSFDYRGSTTTAPSVKEGSEVWNIGFKQAWADFNGDGQADYCRVNVPSGPININLVCVLNPPGEEVFGSPSGPTIVSSNDIAVNGLRETDEGGWGWPDVNGDGLADHCRPVKRTTDPSDHTGRIACKLSAGTAFGDQIVLDGDFDYGRPSGRAWVDFNGDGKADYCRVRGSEDDGDGTGTVGCILSSCEIDPQTPGRCLDGPNSGLLEANTKEVQTIVGPAMGRAWVDFNGDGKADYCRLDRGGAEAISCTVSTGVGFGATYTASTPLGHSDMRDSIAWVDYNGDGKADFCRILGGNLPNENTHLACTLSTGVGWDIQGLLISDVIDSGFNLPFPDDHNFDPVRGQRSDPVRRWVDFNGDGRPDFCRLVALNLGPPLPYAALAMRCTVNVGMAQGEHGRGFGKEYTTEMLDLWVDYVYAANQWADVNGDGAADFCRVEDFVKNHVWQNPVAANDPRPECRITENTYSDELDEIDNGYGARTGITYVSSKSRLKEPASASVPFFLTPGVVTTSLDADGVNPASTFQTAYTLSNGVYNPVERRFIGFKSTSADLPCVAKSPTTQSCPTQEVRYKVGLGTLIAPEVEYVWDRASSPRQLLSATVHVQTQTGLGPSGTAPYVMAEAGRYDYAFTEGLHSSCPTTWPKGTSCASGRRTFTEFGSDLFASAPDLSGTVPQGIPPVPGGAPTVTWKSGYGNETVRVEHGDFDLAGDERTFAKYYYRDPARYVTLGAKSDLWKGDESTARGSANRPLLTQAQLFFDGADCQADNGDGYLLQRDTPPGGSCATGPTVPLARRNPTRTTRWVSGSTFVSDQLEYDNYGNVTATIDELGNRTTYEYDSTFRLFLTRTTNALNQRPSALDTYDYRCGEKEVSYDLNNQSTRVTRDNLCRPTRIDSPGNGVKTLCYETLGNPAAQNVLVRTATAVDASASPPSIVSDIWERDYFDGLGRVYRTARQGPAAGQDIQEDATFNSRGSVQMQSGPYYAHEILTKKKLTTLYYDALERPVRLVHPDNKEVNAKYEVSQARSSKIVEDETHHGQKTATDAYGQLVSHAVAANTGPQFVWDSASYVYDLSGNKKSSTGPTGSTASYVYDNLGRLIQKVTPDQGKTDYTYDAAGRVIWRGDNEALADYWIRYYQRLSGGTGIAASRQVTEYAYDALGRKTAKLLVPNAPGTSTPAPTTTFSWAYDQVRTGTYNGVAGFVFSNKGRLTTTTDPRGTDTFDYDAAGHVIRRTRTIDGTPYTFEWGYDVAGRPLWTKYPDNTTVGSSTDPRTYDAAGRPSGIPGFISGALYDADGQITSWTNLSSPTTTVTTRTYDDNRRWLKTIRTVKSSNPPVVIQDETYNYFDDALLQSVTSPFAKEGWTYAYDGKRQLLGAVNANDSTYNQTFTYGSQQNMLTNSRLGSYAYGSRMGVGSAVHVQSCGGMSFYAQDAAGPHAVLQAGSQYNFKYDIQGDMACGYSPALGAFRMERDVDGRMTLLETAGNQNHYDYDAEGNRIREWHPTTMGTSTTHFVGDDYETDGATIRKYVRLGSLLVGKVQGVSTSSNKFWLHTVRDGSLQAVTNPMGSPIWRRLFRPYGEEVLVTGWNFPESHSFVGERREFSGLMFLNARYYEPILGRFTAADSIVPTTAPIGLNRYAYGNNDPINMVDPGGQFSIGIGFGGPFGGVRIKSYEGWADQGGRSPYPQDLPDLPDGLRPVLGPDGKPIYTPHPDSECIRSVDIDPSALIDRIHGIVEAMNTEGQRNSQKALRELEGLLGKTSNVLDALDIITSKDVKEAIGKGLEILQSHMIARAVVYMGFGGWPGLALGLGIEILLQVKDTPPPPEEPPSPGSGPKQKPQPKPCPGPGCT